MKKIVISLCFVTAVAVGFMVAQSGPSADGARETVDESFVEMTNAERIAKLTEIETQYRSEGKIGAADFIANQRALITN